MKRRVEFFCTAPGLVDVFPIEPTTKHVPRWAEKARRQGRKHNPIDGMHLSNCPGIFMYITLGWVVRSWHDIFYKKDETIDGLGYNFAIPSPDLKNMLTGKDCIQVQGMNSPLFKDLFPTPPWANPNIIKVNTPWHMIAPKGLRFLMLPMPYPDVDNHDFYATSGILDPGYSSDINVQLYWTSKKKEGTIKAGTPLAIIVPLSENKIEMECRDATVKDRNWLKKQTAIKYLSFSYLKEKCKHAYHQHFNKDAK